MNNKIKLFTHTDLDGVGSAILANTIYGEDNVDVEYCNPETINGKVVEFVDSLAYENYSFVFITDLSISLSTAELIDNIQPKSFKNGLCLNNIFQLLDHHSTSFELNKYWWCDVREYNNECNDYKTSGTYMFYNFLKECGDLDKYLYKENILYSFADIIRSYDTWEWKENENISAKQLNDLFYIVGRENFVDNFSSKLINYSSGQQFILFDEIDLLLLNIEKDKIAKYVKQKSHELVYKDYLDYKVGLVFAEQYISQLGNDLSELNPDLDFIAIVNLAGKAHISLRTTKDNIYLGGNIASKFGGGGHAKAAGFSISKEIMSDIIDLIM